MKIDVVLDKIKVENSTEELDHRITALEEDSERVHSSIERIDSQIEHNHSDIVDLQTRTIQNEDDIILIKLDIENLKNRVTALENKPDSSNGTSVDLTEIIENLNLLNQRVETLENAEPQNYTDEEIDDIVSSVFETNQEQGE